jgi:alpha-tubulin suppressor-like RCC1 family protein
LARFLSGPGGVELENAFLTEAELVDRYVGNQLWVWGRNGLGALGDGTNIARSSPVQTVGGGTNWIMAKSPGGLSVGIKTDGTLWTWGQAELYGALGQNSQINRSSPVQTVAGGINWKQASCSFFNVGAIKTDGTLWIWGENGAGALGTNNLTHRSSPVQTVAGGTNWKEISISSTDSARSHIAAIKIDGTLWVWGNNSTGRLGDGTISHRSSPVQTIAGGTNWKQVATGDGGALMVAIKTDGTLWNWGNNGNGALGDGTNIDRSSPVQTIAGGNNWKQASAGSNHAAAIKTDGTLWLWGRGDTGRLGDNTIITRSSPIQTISGGSNWKMVSCGESCVGAIKTDGTLWVWGENDVYGKLGIGSINDDKSSPVQTIAGGTNWKFISVANYSMMATTFTES